MRTSYHKRRARTTEGGREAESAGPAVPSTQSRNAARLARSRVLIFLLSPMGRSGGVLPLDFIRT